MDLSQLQALCMSFPHATQDIKWEHDICFSIGGKMFLVTSDDLPLSASLKLTDEEFEEWSVKPGCMPAPYLARHKWVLIQDLGLFPASEIKRLAQQSYALVLAKLPKKLREQVTGDR